MQDRFLFRGRTGKSKYWHIGYLRIEEIGEIGDNEFRYSIYTGKNRINIDPATIGQCTGLKDKNGKLIFEGDIIHLASDAKFNDGKIAWDDGLLHYAILFPNGAYRELGLMHGRIDIEIIGNIHDTAPTEI